MIMVQQMPRLILFLLTLFISEFAMAQGKLDGSYRLTGSPEMASAFLFREDGTFEFFFSYGAVDRNATGRYALHGDTLTLHSDKEAGKDFTVVKAEKKGNGYHVKISNPNAFLTKHVLAVALAEGKENLFESDGNGEIKIALNSCDKLYLQHQLFPDALSLIKDSTNTNNDFEVTLNPSLAQVSFKGIAFLLKDDALTCGPNYFFPMEKVRFVKE